MKENYQTADEMLNAKFRTNKNLANSSKQNKSKNAKENNKKSKKNVVGIVALITAGIIALTSGVIILVNHFKNKNKGQKTKSESSITELSDMGAELEFPEEKTKEYGKTTGKVDTNKIVEKNGKIYTDEENADKSNKVGTSSIDTKGDTLKVESDGTVKEKTEGYEIKDENVVVDKGEGKIPEGYAWDSVLNVYLPKEEVGKYTYSDATYYDENGVVMINKGEVVSVETLNNAKKYLTTTKPSQSAPSNTTSSSTSSTSSSTSQSNIGVLNADGTYTISGLTFESKADYEQWVLQGYEGYAEADGIMKPESEIQKQLVK